MAQTITLSLQEYESFVSLARAGVTDGEQQRRIDEFLKVIERQNGITRDAVWVQWQEMDSELPAGTRFPETWPPELRRHIELMTRRVAKADVDAVIAQYARAPVNVLVTRDPGARYGWTPIADFFVA
jgi:hypothetical protein